MLPCCDEFTTTFATFPEMLRFHELEAQQSIWKRVPVKDLRIEPLDACSSLYGSPEAFAPEVSEDAVLDTAKNLGLALKIHGEIYPVRTTAYKSLLDRAKISGSALPKLKRKDLAGVLNSCLALHASDALLLLRDEKVSAVHSGDETDYSVLPMDKLLGSLKKKMDERFPGNFFQSGYTDHAITSACWTFPEQKEELLGAYTAVLEAQGKKSMASRLIPGIRFLTSDTGVASAKVSAMLMGTEYPIHIGGCLAVDHRHQKKVSDFEDALDQLFAQFRDSVAALQRLTEIELEYPVNAMTRICKKLSLPKKEALEAIAMFDMALGGCPATAHDVFLALQEIPYLLKTHHVSEAKMLTVQENMARALTLNWSDYDLARAVNY